MGGRFVEVESLPSSATQGSRVRKLQTIPVHIRFVDKHACCK